MKKALLITVLCLCYYVGEARVYYTSPTGKETDLSKVTRDNPANWRAITQGDMALKLQCGDSVLLRWDQGFYTEGTRIYATGCSDTANGAIHYLSEPGGFAVFKIKKYPNNDSRSLDRYVNPSNLVIGGEYYLKSNGDGWNHKSPTTSTKGRYVWISNISMVGNYGTASPKRDFSNMNMIYGSTGARDPGTIAGSQNYDNMTGGIAIGAYGCRVQHCLFWNLGKSGVGVSSSIDKGNATFYGNVVTNTGHAGPKKDHFHSVYNQWLSTNEGYLIHENNIYQFSAEEQLQLWSQGGVYQQDGKWISKVDKVKLLSNIMINAGTLSAPKHVGRHGRNALVGGYTFDNDIQIIGNISWHDKGGLGWQSGYANHSGNHRANFLMKDNFIFGEGTNLMNIQDFKDISGNTFVSKGHNSMKISFVNSNSNQFSSTKSRVNGNRFFGPNDFNISKFQDNGTRISSESMDFVDWQKNGFDKSSQFSSGNPEDKIWYFPSKWEGDWKGHIALTNFSQQDFVTVNLNKFGLNPGDKFRIIDVQNIAANVVDNYIFEGLYDAGMTVTLPMNLTEVVKDPTGEMAGPFHSDKRFNTFMVIRTNATDKTPLAKPVAFAGEDVNLTLPVNSYTLNASNSIDKDGSIVSYNWQLQSGPTEYVIYNANSAEAVITNLVAGTYTVVLTVIDNDSQVSTDTLNITVLPGTESKPSINSISLYDAKTDKPIQGYDPIKPGDKVNLDAVSSADLCFQINCLDKNVNSIKFAYETNQYIENSQPFKIFDETEGVTANWKPKKGKFSLLAIPYTEESGKGIEGEHLQLDIEFESTIEPELPETSTSQSVVSFTLINADNNQPITGYETIVDGSEIKLYELPTQNLNIRANTDPEQVGSVQFDLNGQVNFKTENIAPYALHSDNGGNYNPWTPAAGEYIVSAKPFSEGYRLGEVGTPLQIQFTVVTEAPVEEELPEVVEEEEEEEIPEIITGQSVVSFTLINADNNQPIAGYETIADGSEIKLYELPTQNLNIRANTDPESVGSVQFDLNGQVNFKTENIAPYALHSDNGGNYNPWTPAAGEYLVTATPFSEGYRAGEIGNSLQIQFTVITEAPVEEEIPEVIEEEEKEEIPEVIEEEEEEEIPEIITGQSVVSFTLINADNNQPIAGYETIADGTEIKLYELPTQHVNIRANTDPESVGSVQFDLNGQVNFKTENIAPYALHSDNGGNYNPWTPDAGEYLVTATPFSEGYRAGEIGNSLQIQFTVITEASVEEEIPEEIIEPEVDESEIVDFGVISFTLIDADSNSPIPGYEELIDGEYINLQELPTKNINIRANTNPETVGSVRFDLNDQVNFVTENIAPYALFSDTNGNYNAWVPTVGKYNISAVPFTEGALRGEFGQALSVQLNIIDEVPAGIVPEKYMIYPNPNEGHFDFEPVDKDVKIVDVKIYDGFGILVYSRIYNSTVDKDAFTIPDPRSGNHSMIINTEHGTDVIKIIVEL